MAVGEDREVLATGAEMVGETGARKRLGHRVSRKARPPLLAIGDDRLAGGLAAGNRVPGRRLLLDLQLSLLISLASYCAYAACSLSGRGSEPTGSVGIPVSVCGS